MIARLMALPSQQYCAFNRLPNNHSIYCLRAWGMSPGTALADFEVFLTRHAASTALNTASPCHSAQNVIPFQEVVPKGSDDMDNNGQRQHISKNHVRFFDPLPFIQ